MEPTLIVVFDGVCNLCNGVVQFVIEHDSRARFRFAALQSPAGQRLLASHHFPLDAFNTFVVVEDDRAYTKSDAALRIARHLSGPWPVLGVLRILPRPIRDWLYGQIVAHRYQWFGKRDTCMVPTAELRSRFVE